MTCESWELRPYERLCRERERETGSQEQTHQSRGQAWNIKREAQAGTLSLSLLAQRTVSLSRTDSLSLYYGVGVTGILGIFLVVFGRS